MKRMEMFTVENIKIGFIGLGQRGYSLIKDVLVPMGANITAVCDVYEDRAAAAAEFIEKSGASRPEEFTDHKKLLADADINTVVIATSWEYHVPIAVEAMHRGLAVGLEVGGAYSVEQCYQLLYAYNETKVPFMFLENCCFGRRELMVLNMVKKGLFGKIVHCAGGYGHDLREEVTTGAENRHYRLRNYLDRNCENYPTHEIGPISRILGINHGNRFMTLSSFASGSFGMKEYVKTHRAADDKLQGADFKQGDVITTVITCAGGETVTITLETGLPRYYSRMLTVCGTKGMYEEASDSVFLDCEEDRKKEWRWRDTELGNAKKYAEEYDSEIWKKMLCDGVKGGHGGMDWLEFEAFFDCLKNDKPMPIDIYDAVTWMAITPLSETSVALGGKPMEFPDFTNGMWINR